MTPRQITHSTPPVWTGNEYSSMTAFNCDNTRLLLIRVDHFMLCDGETGNFIKDLPIAASQEPRWSRTVPNLLYFISGLQLLSLDVSSTALGSLVHAFTEYSTISGKGESDLSPSGWMVFAGKRSDNVEEVFVFDLNAGAKGQVFPQAVPIDGLKITSNNQAIVSNQDGIWVCE